MSRNIDTQRCVKIAIAFAIVATSLTSAQDSTESFPIVAPVKVLSSGNQPAEMPAMNLREAAPDGPQPTLPGGKLPQYQVGRASRTSLSTDELDDARLRFLLALPAHPILVEAEITIDGRPFRMAREQRIEQILEALRQPPPGSNNEAVSDIPGEGDASGAADVESATDDAEQNSTEPAEEEVEDDDAVEEEAGEPEQEPVTPATAAPYSLANSATEYIRRYVAATGQAASADEVRWLLANWSDGPVLLLLQENFQRFRARERPAFDVLDRDRNGTVAAAELELAVQFFNECDLNRDEVVDYTEIARAADDPRVRVESTGDAGAVIFGIPDEASAASTYERLAACYSWANPGGADTTTTLPRFDADADGRFDRDELLALQTGESDVKLVVRFNTGDASESTISVTAVTAAGDEADQAMAVDSTIAVPMAGATVVFSAVQQSGSDQVSLGAVVDGYPILPEIDPNDDGRFTIREMRGLIENLRRLDRNADGLLTSDEVQAPIRVCFGLGPVVHRELAGIRSVYRTAAAVVEGPDWFVRMDRNGDRDLTRGEFPGNDEQFTALDADSDALISAAEALDFDQKSRETDDDAAAPETQTPAAPESETE